MGMSWLAGTNHTMNQQESILEDSALTLSSSTIQQLLHHTIVENQQNIIALTILMTQTSIRMRKITEPGLMQSLSYMLAGAPRLKAQKESSCNMIPMEEEQLR